MWALWVHKCSVRPCRFDAANITAIIPRCVPPAGANGAPTTRSEKPSPFTSLPANDQPRLQYGSYGQTLVCTKITFHHLQLQNTSSKFYHWVWDTIEVLSYFLQHCSPLIECDVRCGLACLRTIDPQDVWPVNLLCIKVTFKNHVSFLLWKLHKIGWTAVELTR